MGAKTITPPVLQVPPRASAASASVVGGPPETSIFWRFLVASAILWIGLAATGRLKRVALRAHLWFAALGFVLFFANFLFFYNAERFVASGVVSVMFAMTTSQCGTVTLW